MKKIYISIPMNGREPDEIKDDFNKALLDCVAEVGEELELIQSFFDDKAKENLNDKGEIKDFRPIEMLGESIKLMQDADYYAFYGTPDEFRNSRGCQIEYQVAQVYKINTLAI